MRKTSVSCLGIRLVALLLGLVSIAGLHALEADLEVRNQFSVSGLAWDDLSSGMADFGWKPDLFGEYFLSPDIRLSVELSLDNRLELLFAGEDSSQEISTDLYRAWVAASYHNTELKAGLQHIRMGVAQIYRPLQWFDTIDPLSLLQDSEGVQALTLTHFFPNPELRVWILPGTGETKGNEFFATKKGTAEFGTRLGVLSFLGETGLSYHQRVISHVQEDITAVNEFRLGLDQRVDTVIGAWYEADFQMLDQNVSLSQSEGFGPKYRYTGSATLGADYTLGIGKGLYLLGEANYFWKLTQDYQTTAEDYHNSGRYQGALVLRYPLSLLDEVQVYSTFNTYNASPVTSALLSWRRTYDLLSWDISLSLADFQNPQSRNLALKLVINYDI
ncbi:MAG: hypothetical protein RBS43_01580 [Candidatus Cloacimonas sp.]|nr:hypothetical protein [Candidatus Cloacimonas sp.]